MTDAAFLSRFVRDHVDVMARVNWNKIDLREGFTKQTARVTCDICLWLHDNGYTFACEVKMKGAGLRADILVPQLYGSQVIEIMDSENEASIAEKRIKYDRLGVTMLEVPADQRAIGLIVKANGLKVVSI